MIETADLSTDNIQDSNIPDIDQENDLSLVDVECLVNLNPTWADLLLMIKTREFLLLYLMNFLSVFLGLFIANEYKVYWLNSGFAPEEEFLATVGALGSICNGMRFTWAALLDKYRYKVVYGTM
jgi:Na+/melibiose symporter-like transporter